MRIAICDDSIQEQRQVIEALHAYDPTRQPECYTSGRSLLTAASQIPPFDIVFLDIYMPGENGVKTAEKLQKISPSTGIVFVTTSEEHAVDAFSLHALHYLVKPVTAAGVTESLRRLAELREKKRPVVVLTSGNDSYTVYLDEINYIQSAAHAKEVVLTSGRVIKGWMSMEELKNKLGESFLKLNRSSMVNMEQIERMSADACLLKDGTRLEFARRERGRVRAAYDNYLFTRLSEPKNPAGEWLP
ncbi:LytR/AlgR family response regulator transcription factor [Faecalicatena orotica]|uniref:LytR/AlgR family response regulator transcription factor n=1 Tax=Faecalicatena orotica TaxID=1544 RepID=UPI003217384C